MHTPEDMQAWGKALEAAKEYADTLLKAPLSEVGGILSDTIGYWRLKNQVRLMLKAKKWLENKGVRPDKLLPDIFVPILEEGGNVEDETLADMFASLLAGHVDPERQEKVHPSFAKVLAQLSPLDAKLMLAFRNHVSDEMYRSVGLGGHVLIAEDMAREIEMPIRATCLSCLNLERLGIVKHFGHRAPDDHPIPTMFEDSPAHQLYRMSEYGVEFCDACQYQGR